MIQESTSAILTGWDSFYVIVGSSAAALTGLMFVVITLVADRRFDRSVTDVATFGTPTVIHFGAVLFLSAVLSAPWRTMTSPSLLLGISAFGALGYISITTIRAVRSTGYQPVLEDWIFHIVIPFTAYSAMLVGAVLMPRDAFHGMFILAGSSILLLFDGIHNSWDTVTYLATTRAR